MRKSEAVATVAEAVTSDVRKNLSFKGIRINDMPNSLMSKDKISLNVPRASYKTTVQRASYSEELRSELPKLQPCDIWLEEIYMYKK